MRRAVVLRNVLMAVFGVSLLVLKPAYQGPFGDLCHAYGGNIAVSFALYFASINATSRYQRPRLMAAVLTLLAVELFEVADGFGFMQNVFDPFDLIANVLGVAIAIVVDVTTGLTIQRRFTSTTGSRRSES